MNLMRRAPPTERAECLLLLTKDEVLYRTKEPGAVGSRD